MSQTRNRLTRAEREKAALEASQSFIRKPEPNLSQGHLLDQIEQYYASVGVRVDAANKKNIRKGACRAFSFVKGLIELEGEAKWWMTLLSTVKNWDGRAESLDELIDTKRCLNEGEVAIVGNLDEYIQTPHLIHTGVGFPLQLTRRQMFAIVEHNIMLAQSGREQQMGGYQSDEDYRYGNDIQYRDNDGTHHTFGTGYYVTGNFSFDRFKALISHPHFKAALADSICLVYSNDHACKLAYNKQSQQWNFYNPNYRKGQAHTYGKGEAQYEKLFVELDEDLGSEKPNRGFNVVKNETIDLSFEVVRGENALAQHPMTGYNEMLQRNPFEVLLFNHRKKSGKETNFASEFYICDQASRTKLAEAISHYAAGRVLSSVEISAMKKLMMAAVSHKDIEWFTQLVSACHHEKLLGAGVRAELKAIVASMAVSKDSSNGAMGFWKLCEQVMAARQKTLSEKDDMSALLQQFGSFSLQGGIKRNRLGDITNQPSIRK